MFKLFFKMCRCKQKNTIILFINKLWIKTIVKIEGACMQYTCGPKNKSKLIWFFLSFKGPTPVVEERIFIRYLWILEVHILEFLYKTITSFRFQFHELYALYWILYAGACITFQIMKAVIASQWKNDKWSLLSSFIGLH